MKPELWTCLKNDWPTRIDYDPTGEVGITEVKALYAIPAGYKLVPIEPTEKQLNHCCDLGDKNPNYYMDREECEWHWKMMLEAAPKIEDIPDE